MYHLKINLSFFIFLCFCLFFSFFLFFLSFFFVNKSFDFEKLNIYECGFDPFGNARVQFDIQFYLIAILFIIFDLEMLFLFPWVFSFFNLGFFGKFVMFFFLIILILGFYYEFFTMSLEW